MLNFIYGLIITTLSIIGFVEIIRISVVLIMKPKTEYAVLMIKANNEKDIEYTVKSWVTYSKWQQSAKSLKIYILLNNETNNENREICQKLAKDFECVKILETEEHINLLEII